MDIAVRGQLSLDRVQAIEARRTTKYAGRTLAALERGLEWAPGSVRRILAGGEPTEAEQDAPSVLSDEPPQEEANDDLLKLGRELIEQSKRLEELGRRILGDQAEETDEQHRSAG